MRKQPAFSMRSFRRNLGYRFARVLGASVALVCAGVAPAQVERLPEAIVTSSGLSAAEEAQIKQFVQSQFERLRSDDPGTVEDARRSLESPFERDEPSINFRLAYERSLILEIRPLLNGGIGGGASQAVISGLLVAGRCGTPQAVDLLGEVVAGRHPDAVRTAAVAGLHEVLRGVPAGRVREEWGREGVRAVGQALADADNAILAKSCVIALSATERQAIHGDAARAIARAIPTLASRLANQQEIEEPTRWAQVMQLSLRLISTHVLQVGGRADAEFARSAVEAAGHAMAFAGARMSDAGPEALASTGEGAQLAALLKQAEQLAILAGRGLRGATARQEALESAWNESLETGDEGAFEDAMDSMLDWIENATGLERADFGL